MLEIIKAGNPVLAQPAAAIKKFDRKLHKTIEQMEETLRNTTDPRGVGLAAPQVGLSIRMFLIKPHEKSRVMVFINPKLVSEQGQTALSAQARRPFATDQPASKRKRKILEGCLSLPNIWGHVSREREVEVVYQDSHGRLREKTFKGFAAIIIQHELDHLNGILFTKHVMEQNEKLYRSYKNEKGADEFAEIKI